MSLRQLSNGLDEMPMELSQRSINERASSEIFSQLSILSCRKNFYEQYLSTSVIQQNFLEKIKLLPLEFDEHTINNANISVETFITRL